MNISPIRVLIVDDYEPWRRFIISRLEREPGLLIVDEASDGLAAIDKAQALRPELIFLDIGLPKLNGIEAARQIQQHSSHSKIIFVSENSSPDIAEEALGTGAIGYVVKSDAAGDLLPALVSALQGKRFVSRRFLGPEFGKAPGTHLPGKPEHVVRFYTDDTVLLGGLGELFRRSLNDGESVVAVTTSSHRIGLEERLIEQGIDVSATTKEGRLVFLDADQALAEFMNAKEPRRERFLLHFGNIFHTVQAAALVKRRIVVFGEMVAVLWDHGNYEAAIQLEELWNELALAYSFYLCCAYPAGAFHETSEGSHYAMICAQHSKVVSAR